jgi:hypothetical protein
MSIPMAGCFAQLKADYLVATYDPATDLSKYYRVDLDGTTYFSQSKFSRGSYDRSAVSRLFSEGDLQREYLATYVEQFDGDGKKIRDLTDCLNKAAAAAGSFRRVHVVSATASLAEVIGRYQVRLTEHEEARARFEAHVAAALALLNEAKTQLKTDADASTDAALFAVRQARGLMQQVRAGLDGKTVVRFFDGAGVEQDPEADAVVIFVSADASRFTEAIRQLVVAED